MKTYISGKITGTNDYINRFINAELELIQKGRSVVNPATVNAVLPEDTTWEEYMEMSRIMLGMCDEIYMLKGWEESKGACIEMEWAIQRGMIITYQQDVCNMEVQDDTGTNQRNCKNNN